MFLSYFWYIYRSAEPYPIPVADAKSNAESDAEYDYGSPEYDYSEAESEYDDESNAESEYYYGWNQPLTFLIWKNLRMNKLKINDTIDIYSMYVLWSKNYLFAT